MNFDWQPVFLSLQVAAGALLVILAPATLAALWMSRGDFRGKEIVEGVLLLPLVLPPVVTGYALLILIGRRGWLGFWLEKAFDIRLIFTPQGAMLASAAVAFPLMYGSAKAAFLALDPHWRDAAQSLGATPPRVFWTVILPLSWPGLLTGATLSFARALGEFGATILVAGNIAGKTTTAAIAIYMAAEDGDLTLAGKYSALLAVLNFVFLIGLGIWMRRQRQRDKL